jgi:hypothetical protein
MDKHNPIDHFSLPARVLIVSGVFLAAAGFWANVEWGLTHLPSGSYPLFYFAIPALVVGVLYVLLGFVVLRSLGVRVYREPPTDKTPPTDQAPDSGASA